MMLYIFTFFVGVFLGGLSVFTFDSWCLQEAWKWMDRCLEARIEADGLRRTVRGETRGPYRREGS